MNSNIGKSIPNNTKYKEEEYLAPFLEHLRAISQTIGPDESLIVYRTQHIVPVDEFGQTPNVLRARTGTGRKVSRKYTKEEVDNLSLEDRTTAVGKYGLSCNPTEEAAEVSFMNGYKKLLSKNPSKEEIDEFIRKRGEYICRYILKNYIATVTEFRNDHANIYLYAGVNLEDCRDKTYEPRKINYQSYEE